MFLGLFSGVSWDPSWGQGFHPGDPGMVGAFLAAVLHEQCGSVVRVLILFPGVLPFEVSK